MKLPINVTQAGKGTNNSSRAAYTVDFNANGGSVSAATRTVTDGMAVGELPAATRDGYTLNGWFTASSGGTQITAATVVTANVTYYAQWTKDPDPVPVPPDPELSYEVLNASDIKEAFEAPKAVTLQGAAYDGNVVVGIVELKLGKVNAKKGTGKVSGTVTTLDGKKYAIKAYKVTNIDGATSKAVALEVKNFGTMAITVGGTRFAGTMGNNYHVQSADVGGNWTGRDATVTVDSSDLSMFAGTVLSGLLPGAEKASVSDGKWTFAKAAGVKWAKPKKGAALPDIYDEASGKGLIVDDTNGKTNLSGLKLSYTPKKGTFKGSFKVHALEGAGKATKLKKYTISVGGVVVDGVGYGTATCRKPAVSWSVTVR